MGEKMNKNVKMKNDLSKNYKIFGGINLISIVPLCLIENVWFNMKYLWKDSEGQQILIVLLFLLVIFLIVNMLITFLISLFSFMKARADVYRLLLMLGIAKKDFWKLLLHEYCMSTVFLVLKITLVSQVLGVALTSYIFRNVVVCSIQEYFFNMCIMFFFTMFVYFAVMLLSVCIIIYKYRSCDIIAFFEKYVQSDAKLHRSPAVYAVNPLAGIGLVVISFLLLINYNVSRMIIAVFANSIGVLILIHVDGHIIKRMIKKFKRIYYCQLMKWNNFFYQYKVNAKIVFVIYSLNFLLTFIIGGLIVSVGSNNYHEKYPYEIVAYGSHIHKNIDNYYLCVPVKINPGGTAIAISSADFHKITPSDMKIDRGEILYYREEAAETFPPLENIAFLTVENGGEKQQYRILDADWKILFGENIFPELSELSTIVILNDEDFLSLAENNEIKTIYATNDLCSVAGLENNTENKIWYKSEQVEKDTVYDNIVMTILLITGMVFIFEIQFLVLIRQLLDDTNENYQYEILIRLGIQKNELRKIQMEKIKNLIFFPEVFAIVTGIIFFMADYFYQTQGNIEWAIWFQYMALQFCFGVIQYIGYRIIICVINRYYNGGN
jgi:hypothetical protein